MSRRTSLCRRIIASGSTKNMLLTQHTGGGTGDEADRKIDVFIDNLGRYRRGEAPFNVVDFKRGY